MLLGTMSSVQKGQKHLCCGRPPKDSSTTPLPRAHSLPETQHLPTASTWTVEMMLNIKSYHFPNTHLGAPCGLLKHSVGVDWGRTALGFLFLPDFWAIKILFEKQKGMVFESSFVNAREARYVNVPYNFLQTRAEREKAKNNCLSL